MPSGPRARPGHPAHLPPGPLFQAVRGLDAGLERVAVLFHIIANACLGGMLIGTAATILLRLVNTSFYWIWPWTMQFFVWMSFFGFFVVYRRRKDIAIDFVIRQIGGPAFAVSRYFVNALILVVTGTILLQMRIILESQVGVIDGVLTPWGELERYTLSIPLALSCALIFLDTLVDTAMAMFGQPEPGRSAVQPDSGA